MKEKHLVYLATIFWSVALLVGMWLVEANAASTATVTRPTYKNGIVVHQIDITADAADGSIDDVAITGVCGLVTMVSVEPGTPAPTDQYDIALVEDRTDTEIMGWELLDLEVTAAAQFAPRIGGSYAVRPVCGDLTLTVANNVVTGAKLKVSIYEVR